MPDGHITHRATPLQFLLSLLECQSPLISLPLLAFCFFLFVFLHAQVGDVVVLLLHRLFILEHDSSLLLEIVEELWFLALYLHKLLEVELLVDINFDLMFLNQTIELCLYLC